MYLCSRFSGKRWTRTVGLVILLAGALLLASCGDFFTPVTGGSGGGGGGGTGGTPKFAYTANFSGGAAGSVSAFTVNSSTGALTETLGSPFAAGTGPVALGADVNGKFLYVSHQGGGVAAYTINRNDGTLTLVNTALYNTGASPSGIAVDPQARYVYVANNGSSDISSFTINSSTGALTPLANTTAAGGAPVNAIEDPTGHFVYVPLGAGGTGVFKINSDGSLASVDTVKPAPCAASYDVALDSNSRFAYTVDNSGSVCGYAVNASNGDLMLITTTAVPAGTKPVAVAVAGGNKYLFVANQGSNNVSAYAINSDGTLAAVSGSPFAAGNTPVALSVDPSSSFVYVANFNDSTVTLFKIGSNGALSSSGTAQAGLNPNAVVVTQ